MINDSSRDSNWIIVFLQWILLNAVGWGIGLIIVEIVSNLPKETNIVAAFVVLVTLATGLFIAGIVIGLAQWVILQQHFHQINLWWILVGFLELLAYYVSDGARARGIIAILQMSVTEIGIIATIQWFILRQYDSRAKWLLVANIIGSVVGWGIYYYLYKLIFEFTYIFASSVVVKGAVGMNVIIVGVWLAWLLSTTNATIKKMQRS